METTIKKRTMQISVFKANEEAANKLFSELEALNPNLTDGTKFIKIPVTRNKETGEQYKKGSFIIRRVKVENPKMGITIFRFLRTMIGKRVEWDERYINLTNN